MISTPKNTPVIGALNVAAMPPRPSSRLCAPRAYPAVR
jgi:hypothetical protein